MGQANLRACTDELLGMLVDETPRAYEHFQKKEKGMVKVVCNP